MTLSAIVRMRRSPTSVKTNKITTTGSGSVVVIGIPVGNMVQQTVMEGIIR